jgi:thiamine-phosphate diphosphorylase
MQIKGIYVITDEQLVPGRSHVEIAKAALTGGAAIIQLRDKLASDEYLIRVGRAIREMSSAVGALFIVNDRMEVALACDADGIHVGQSDPPPSQLRPLFPKKIIGVSASTPEEAMRALADGADYIGVGPIFATSTKPDAGKPIGLQGLATIRAAVPNLPIVAIGGINEHNIAEVAKAGADAASVISAVVCASDMVEATRKLVEIWESQTRT